MPAAKREHAPAGKDGAARWDRGHRLGVEAGEAEPLAGEGVDVGGAGALAERVVRAQRVHDDHEDVGPVRRLPQGELVEAREQAGRGPRGLQELAARARASHPAQIVRWGGGPIRARSHGYAPGRQLAPA